MAIAKRRKRAPKPKSADAYAAWKARLTESTTKKQTSTPPSLSNAPFPIPTLTDNITDFLTTSTSTVTPSSIQPLTTNSKYDEVEAPITLPFSPASPLPLTHPKLSRRTKNRLHKDIYAKSSKTNPKHRTQRPSFPFAKLPPELRRQCYRYIFANSSAGKPSFLWALREWSLLYGEARRVWCEVNEFRFSLKEMGGVEGGGVGKVDVNERDGLEGWEMELVRWGRVDVPLTIENSTPLSRKVLLCTNLTHLTLTVSTAIGLALSIHHLIPSLPNLKKVTLISTWLTRDERARNRGLVAGYNTVMADFFRSIVETRGMLDRMLGKTGTFVEGKEWRSKPWRMVWVWEVEGGEEAFVVRRARKHIKFGEEDGA